MAATLTHATPATAFGPQGQPDISYHPDVSKYRDRVQRRQQGDALTATLPDGFPTQLDADLVWEGTSLAEKYDWTFVLDAAQLREIDDAVQHFKSKISLAQADAVDGY
jgi:hypothetical protein